jgi:eukaryotic-like serine/threonine-protein kinase
VDARKYCVVCGSIYRHELRTCPEDGAMLVLEAEQGDRLRVGHVLGNYRLIRKLGEGGVGTVYEGEHVRLGRKMALKVLHPETASAEVIVCLFNEARAVNQIRHPNIVDVEDFVTADTGEHYLIMELLPGEDLRSVISREGVMAPERVSAIGEQMAGALAAVHRCDIVHRDLKPDNIFLSRDSNGREIAKLLDFGIAKFLAEGEGMTREGLTLGTPEYMAPEQIVTTGKPGPGADIYSLGMLMYECVAGAPAFTATTTAAILRGHISEPVVPPSHRRGEPLPPVLEAAILKCLEKDPANRFASGDELAAALRSDRAVQLVTPRFVPSAARRASRALQMLPAFAMAAAALALHLAPRSDEHARAAAPAQPAVSAAPAVAPAVRPPSDPLPTKQLAAEPAPTHIQVALSSSPEGAALFLGETALGEAPTLAEIPISSEPVALTARFADGTEVVQTIVPDRPLPHIAFKKPAPAPAPPEAARTKTRPTSSTKRPAGSGTIQDRDGTMDPFK